MFSVDFSYEFFLLKLTFIELPALVESGFKFLKLFLFSVNGAFTYVTNVDKLGFFIIVPSTEFLYSLLINVLDFSLFYYYGVCSLYYSLYCFYVGIYDDSFCPLLVKSI